MFQLFNLAIHSAPEYNAKRVVGRPINAIIATSMQTPAGRAIFDNKGVNVFIKKMFDVWIVCLTSEFSQPVLNKEKGWVVVVRIHLTSYRFRDMTIVIPIMPIMPSVSQTPTHVISMINISASSLGTISSSESLKVTLCAPSLALN